jgi:cytoskeletal protein RodZ
MNAKEFFDKYEIEEISKKTKISPISLRYIKNKEFEKIPRVKFLGFIKIIEK